jgi:hypothetical protein
LIVDIPLSEERQEELRDNPEVLQEFVAASGVRVVCAMWIVAINLVDDVPGERPLPVAILPATKGVSERRVVLLCVGLRIYCSTSVIARKSRASAPLATPA